MISIMARGCTITPLVISRLFAWLQNFRRLVVRYERNAENSLAMLHLGCCLILLRRL
jgi:transposase